jgi:hypothetical protein
VFVDILCGAPHKMSSVATVVMWPLRSQLGHFAFSEISCAT